MTTSSSLCGFSARVNLGHWIITHLQRVLVPLLLQNLLLMNRCCLRCVTEMLRFFSCPDIIFWASPHCLTAVNHRYTISNPTINAEVLILIIILWWMNHQLLDDFSSEPVFCPSDRLGFFTWNESQGWMQAAQQFRGRGLSKRVLCIIGLSVRSYQPSLYRKTKPRFLFHFIRFYSKNKFWGI